MMRVLKIACGLMGVLLLMMVAVMGVGRHAKDDPDGMIVVGVDRDFTDVRVHVIYVSKESIIHRPITPTFRSLNIIQEYPDRFYFLGQTDESVKLYRIGWDGQGLMAVGGDATFIGTSQIWISDEGWLLFTELSHNNEQILWRVNEDGTGLEQIIPHELTVIGPIAVSADHQWVAFDGWHSAKGRGLFVIPTDNHNRWEQIPIPYGYSLGAFYEWSDTRAHLFVSVAQNDQYSLGRASLGNLEDIHWENFRLPPIPTTIPAMVAELTEQNLVLVSSERLASGDWWSSSNLFAFDLDTLTPRWSLDDTRFIGASPNGQWLLVASYVPQPDAPFGYRVDLKRTRPDGTYYEVLARGLSAVDAVRYSPDGQWIVFSTLDGNGTIDYWRLPADGGELTHLFKRDDNAQLISLSSDNEWLYFQEFRRNPAGIFRQHVTNGVRQIIAVGDSSTSFTHWIRLPLGHWQPPILAAIALTLITTPILLSHLRRLHLH